MKYNTVDAYFERIPEEHLPRMNEVRKAIREAIPEAEEVISYNMPAYRHNGILVYFADYATHIGFYPTPSCIEAFKPQLISYTYAKGSVQFPYDRPLPLSLIRDMARYRFEEQSRATR
jgi:uncharacterized protein YdhG (YjbR/CyaY superfamily)